MGQLIVEQVVSADGFAADRHGTTSFFEHRDASLGNPLQEGEVESLEMMSHVDAILLGANTYKMFSAFWPQQNPRDQRIAKPLAELPKHVFSRSLTEAPWGDFRPAIIERGDLVETVARLKAHYAKDLVLWGSLTLSDTLFRAGIVDVLRLRTVPKLIGDGRLVTPKDIELDLELERVRQYPKGLVNTQYAVVRRA